MLAETITGDTGVSLSVILGLVGLCSGLAIASVVSRVTLSLAVKHLRLDVADHEARLKPLEIDKIRRDAIDEAAVKSSSSTSGGTKPYPR